MSLPCPLCKSKHVQIFHHDRKRLFHHCIVCHLVFVDPTNLPCKEQELNEYKLHQNSSDDAGYLTFLDRARQPVIEFVGKGKRGLDFGSGPEPVLANWLENDGFVMQAFDPFFAPSTIVGEYDFIVCTEAIEHFHQPSIEWQTWMQHLCSDGYLIIMTKRWLSKARFNTWHYKNDPTHVVFFHEKTFRFLAQEFNFSVLFVADDVVVMQRH